MDEEKSFTGKLYDQVEQYAKTTVELYKLKAAKTLSEVFASVATGFILWVLFLFILLFLSIGGAFYLGKLMGEWHYGFLSVAGIYIVILVVIYILRVKCLTRKLNDFIIKQIFKD